MVDMIRRLGRFRLNRIHHVRRVSRVHRVCHFHHVRSSVRNIQGEYNRGILSHLSYKECHPENMFLIFAMFAMSF